ncbi:energy transducer TonB [Parasegetibacter sp. NRK P23]|uniref:energy transducer TonB family protein n=1 Tax=Parasegetibacter sp. NRK P23 TaxID=2942999 RepID=UPI0020443F55|nr:carboxypeptidase-like regulatory domain-containing protein [Parasegetibacter sp. NRK P23]MCM5529972.1 carboxypeptidase-like regulatory domain-containing protein [Parasegetibacter sp. NRK P23]
MTATEMHALEKAALEDPFLADALEGYTAHVETLSYDVVELNLRLNERLKESKENKPVPVVPLRRNWWWSAAAAVLIVVSAAVAYRLIWSNEDQSIARKEPTVKKTKETPLTNANDSGEKTDAPVAPTKEKPTPAKQHVSEQEDLAATTKSSDLILSENDRQQKDKASALQELAKAEHKQAQQRANAMLKNERPAFQIRGEVLDVQQKPVSGVVVTLEKEKTATLTDSLGRFSLRSKDSAAVATLDVLGFVPQKVELKNNTAANRITLENSSAAMEEVVVVGYGRQKKKTVTGSVSKTVNTNPLKAVPEAGWAAYNQYLLDSSRLKVAEGVPTPIVIVSFEVRASGKLTRFRIEQSAGAAYDKEALRLIKEGPSWKTTTGKKETGRVSVTFK